jgi:hypothetical protein
MAIVIFVFLALAVALPADAARYGATDEANACSDRAGQVGTPTWTYGSLGQHPDENHPAQSPLASRHPPARPPGPLSAGFCFGRLDDEAELLAFDILAMDAPSRYYRNH